MNAEADPTLTLDEVSALVGDDVAYWLSNPFLPPDAVAKKVCWWITRAVSASKGDAQ